MILKEWTKSGALARYIHRDLDTIRIDPSFYSCSLKTVVEALK
jgi:hypothetical protein